MSSVATTADNSAARKSLIGDEEESLNKEEINYLTKEVEALNAALALKNKEVELWRSKVHDESVLQAIIGDLQAKLGEKLSEIDELKKAQEESKNNIKSKYIERSEHNEEIVELKAQANYLTSENERLNKIITNKLEAWKTRDDDRTDFGFGEDEKNELLAKLESYTKENERLEKIVEDNAIEILEYNNKYEELEEERNKLKAQLREHEGEISTLKKENEEMEKHIIELKVKKERLEQSQEHSHDEHEKLVKSLEGKKKELEEMRAKVAALGKKEAELDYLKDNLDMVKKENMKFHRTVAEKNKEIEDLKLKCEDFDKKVALIKEIEGKINKLTIERDELVIRCNGKSEALKKQKEINQELMTENNEMQANLRFMEQENMELRQVTEGYERMIEDLKNTVVKGEKGTYRVLSFDPDSLA